MITLINADIIVSYGFIDIVTERYDTGVCLRYQVAKNVTAVPIVPDLGMAVVGSPAFALLLDALRYRA